MRLAGSSGVRGLRVVAGVAGLVVVVGGLGGCTAAAMRLAMARNGSPAAQVGGVVGPNDLPAFEEPELRRLSMRFVLDKKRWDDSYETFFEPVEGPSTCAVSKDQLRSLGLVAELQTSAAAAGLPQHELEQTDFAVRTVAGGCREGLLEGPVRLRVDTTTRVTDENSSGLVRSRVAIEGTFERGRPSGRLSSFARTETTTTVVIAGQDPINAESVQRTFEYRELRGNELTGPSLSFRLMPDLPMGISTTVRRPLEPGLVRWESFDGPKLDSNGFFQDGVPHGSWNIGPMQKCFNAGVEVVVEACDGPRVDVARARTYTMEDQMADAYDAAREGRSFLEARTAPSGGGAVTGRSPESAGSPARPDPGAPAAPGVAAAPSAAVAAPAVAATPASGARATSSAPRWPELPSLMAAVGGGEKDVAVIVGVENYAFVSKVPGAARNAKDWYRYFTRVRGTSPGRVRLLLDNDATDVGLRTAVSEAAELATEGGTLWFIFVGHGAPSADQKDGLLVGVDAQQTAQGLYGRSIAQRELIQLAAAGRQARSVFVVDACFSGRSGSGAALAAGLQPLVTLKAAPVQKGAIVFSAGRADQFAGPLPGVERPAFSYLMLGGLLGWGDANRDGNLSSQELATYSADTLRAVLNGRSQTPEVSSPADLPLAKSAGAQGPDIAAIAIGD